MEITQGCGAVTQSKREKWGITFMLHEETRKKRPRSKPDTRTQSGGGLKKGIVNCVKHRKS